jgi:hypothetical protein
MVSSMNRIGESLPKLLWREFQKVYLYSGVPTIGSRDRGHNPPVLCMYWSKSIQEAWYRALSGTDRETGKLVVLARSSLSLVQSGHGADCRRRRHEDTQCC